MILTIMKILIYFVAVTIKSQISVHVYTFCVIAFAPVFGGLHFAVLLKRKSMILKMDLKTLKT